MHNITYTYSKPRPICLRILLVTFVGLTLLPNALGDGASKGAPQHPTKAQNEAPATSRDNTARTPQERGSFNLSERSQNEPLVQLEFNIFRVDPAAKISLQKHTGAPKNSLHGNRIKPPFLNQLRHQSILTQPRARTLLRYIKKQGEGIDLIASPTVAGIHGMTSKLQTENWIIEATPYVATERG